MKSVVFGIILFLCLTPLFIESHEVAIIAHRGNSSEAPENTLPAFRSAVDNGATCVECDIHLTKEGIPIIIHDRILSRTTNNPATIPVEELSLDEIKALDAGIWYNEQFRGTKILTLSELLEAPLNGIGVMLEVKENSASDAKLAEVVAEVLRHHYATTYSRNIVIGSQSPTIFRELKQRLPYHPVVAIVGEKHWINQFPEADIYALGCSLVSEAIIRELHNKEKPVWVWTVDDPTEMIHLINMNIDGIITNNPKILKELLIGLKYSKKLFVSRQR